MSRTFDEIKTDIDNRMSVYNHSMQPTSDEVTIAWLVTEIERLKSLSGFKEDGKEKGAPFDEWGYDQMKKKDSPEEGDRKKGSVIPRPFACGCSGHYEIFGCHRPGCHYPFD